MNDNLSGVPGGEILLYQTDDGRVRIETQMQGETVWLTQDQMAQLFSKAKSTINEHVNNLFKEGELVEQQVMRKFGNSEFPGKPTNYYNLDVIISVGYRVKSLRGTQFRIWATQRLREYIIKGFTLDDHRLKEAGGGDYFDELLDRIRDIRSSEKVFWKKVLNIYALSIDYDRNADSSRKFFAVVQNKMLWAAHGNTAAEIIDQRADASRANMGLTTWSGTKLRRADAEVAKNYLSPEELDTLNRIVTMYLEFAELQALSRKPMHMRDWISKLDDFLKLSDRELLSHAGAVSHEQALDKARQEYEKYHREHLNDPSPVEKHFLDAVKKLKKLEESQDS
jgi:hypothetical protein